MHAAVTRAALVVVSALAMAALIAGCSGGSSSSHSLSPSASAAVATAKADAQNYLAKCIPSDAVHQIALGKSLLGKDGRQKFATCLAISPANRPKFEADLLTAAEHTKWSDKEQRRNFFSVTLPALAAKYHSAPVPGASANIPGVTVSSTATVTVPATPKASKS